MKVIKNNHFQYTLYLNNVTLKETRWVLLKTISEEILYY